MYQYDDQEAVWARVRDESNIVAAVHAMRHARNIGLVEAKHYADEAFVILDVSRHGKGLFSNMTMEEVSAFLM